MNLPDLFLQRDAAVAYRCFCPSKTVFVHEVVQKYLSVPVALPVSWSTSAPEDQGGLSPKMHPDCCHEKQQWLLRIIILASSDVAG